jgi:sensor histidine kinase YesM
MENNGRLFVEPQRKYEFTAFSLFPTSILEINQNALMVNTLLVVGLILVLFLLLFLLVSRSLTQPLTYVVSTIKRIKQGETSLRLKPMKQDEIGILGHEFNDMLDETERLIKQEYTSQLLLKDAKYKALQAQVNPHFLYNTLDTMSGIANSQECKTVGSLCHALSNVFRYSIDMKSPYATLAQEIAHIKNYAYIINVRMNHSIEINIHVDDSLLEYVVPRLSIQPLVENAIQHGLRNKRGDKNINIGAQLTGEDLEVWVEDNGVGMDTDKLTNQLESSLEDALTKNESIGLDNINARAKILFGDGYGVKIKSEPDKGSRVILRIPVIVNGGETDED